MRNIVINLSFLLVACDNSKGNFKDTNVNEGVSNIDSLTKRSIRDSVVIKDTTSVLDKLSINSVKDLIGSWKVNNYKPLTDVLGYSIDDFKKDKGNIALVISSDSIKFLNSSKQRCKYDSLTTEQFDFLAFIDHLGYNGYDSNARKEIKIVKVISFNGCLIELYFMNGKLFYEFDGVLIEIVKK